MINLNLLPKREKIILKRERNLQIIFLSFWILLLGTSVVGLEIFLTQKFLKENLSIYTSSIVREKEFEEKIKEINSKLVVIDEIQSNYLKITPILLSLAKITPSDVYIKSFTIDKVKGQFQINGWAKERGRLLIFQNNLENIGFFKEIDFPLSNLLREKDINFEFKGKLNL